MARAWRASSHLVLVELGGLGHQTAIVAGHASLRAITGDWGNGHTEAVGSEIEWCVLLEVSAELGQLYRGPTLAALDLGGGGTAQKSVRRALGQPTSQPAYGPAHGTPGRASPSPTP